MVLFLVFIIGIVTATNLVVIYKFSTRQNSLENAIANKKSNNFYLSVKKSSEEEKPQETSNSIVDLSDVTISTEDESPLTYVQKTISLTTDTQDIREKMIVQLIVNELESPNVYRNVKRTFILRKDMDVDEIIECIGEPVDIKYYDNFTDMIYRGPEGKVSLILSGGRLLKIEK
jgi:hypothetical protein